MSAVQLKKLTTVSCNPGAVRLATLSSSTVANAVQADLAHPAKQDVTAAAQTMRRLGCV